MAGVRDYWYMVGLLSRVAKPASLWLSGWLILSLLEGEKLMCFSCDSMDDPRCGVNFTIPQDEAVQCLLENHRCRTVMKEAVGSKDNNDKQAKIFYRDCGPIMGIELKAKDTKNCTRMYFHKTEEHENICFCNKFYCNGSNRLAYVSCNIVMALIATMLIQIVTHIR